MTVENLKISLEEQALLNELRAARFKLNSIWDWVNIETYYPDAVPVLVKHLESAYDDRLVEGISRALTDKRYTKVEKALVRKFGEVKNDSVRWAIANAIVIVGFKNSEDEILKCVKDSSFGYSRERLVESLNRIQRPEVEDVLIDLLEDARLDCVAARALSYCGGQKGLKALESIDLSHRSPRSERLFPGAIARLKRRLDLNGAKI